MDGFTPRRISTGWLAVLCTLLCTFGLVGVGNANDGPHQPINVIGLPDSGLILIGPTDARFDDMANEVLHGRRSEEYEILKPYSAIIQNKTRKTVVAYTIRWEHSVGNGNRRPSRNYSLAQVTGILDGDHRQTEPEESTIGPGDFKIVTFESQIGKKTDSEWLQAPLNDGVRSGLQLEVHEYDEDTDVSVAIDGALFDDASFVGPDKSGFFEDFKAEIDAQQDVMSLIVSSADQGLDQVAAQLQSMVRVNENGFNVPIMPPGDSPSDVYQRHKSRYAWGFLNVRRARGDQAALAWAGRQLFQNSPRFVRQ
jgi:hypothetical protein